MKRKEPEDIKVKRGRPAKEEYSIDALKEKLREIALKSEEKLNPLKLQKLTGIERRNWKKVQDAIDAVNDVVSGVNPEAINAFPLPAIEQSFDLYYGKDKKKLIEIFSSYNFLISKMWNKSVNLDRVKMEYDLKLADVRRENEKLSEQLKKTQEDIKFYKNKYEQLCVESTYKNKREELNIKDNVLQIKSNDKSIMDVNFAEKYAGFLKK